MSPDRAGSSHRRRRDEVAGHLRHVGSLPEKVLDRDARVDASHPRASENRRLATMSQTTFDLVGRGRAFRIVSVRARVARATSNASAVVGCMIRWGMLRL